MAVVSVLLVKVCVGFTSREPTLLSDDQMDSIYGGTGCGEFCHYTDWTCQAAWGPSQSICNELQWVDKYGAYGEVGASGCHPLSEGNMVCGATNECRKLQYECQWEPTSVFCLDVWRYCQFDSTRYRERRCISIPEWGWNGTCECVLDSRLVNCSGQYNWCY